MKPVAVSTWSGILLVAGAFLGGTSHADDRELQAILLKLACVPAKVTSNSLSAALTAYDVTCKGSSKVVYIICRESECRLQPRPREDDER
jgi:hypothetical protein